MMSEPEITEYPSLSWMPKEDRIKLFGEDPYDQIQDHVDENSPYKLFAKFDHDLLSAFIMGHEDSSPKSTYTLSHLIDDYNRWLKLKAEYEFAEHNGSCVKQPAWCGRCHVDEYKEKAKGFERQIFRSYELDENMIKNILFCAYMNIKQGIGG